MLEDENPAHSAHPRKHDRGSPTLSLLVLPAGPERTHPVEANAEFGEPRPIGSVAAVDRDPRGFEPGVSLDEIGCHLGRSDGEVAIGREIPGRDADFREEL